MPSRPRSWPWPKRPAECSHVATVGGWLFGAAVRAARQGARTLPAGNASGRSSLDVLPERARPDILRSKIRMWSQVVLEAVAGLSAVYRAAVVLCELEGRPRSAAARELGIPEGTLSSRLAAARKVACSAARRSGLGPGGLAAVAGAASCPVLAADAARLAGAPEPYSPRVMKLSEEVVRTPVLSKWWAVPAVVLLTAGFVAFAAEPAGRPEAAGRPAGSRG